MRVRYALLVLLACAPALTWAQLPQEQDLFDLELRVWEPLALAAIIHNHTYDYPPPYQPPDRDSSLMLGASVFFRVDPDGDTTSLGVSLADAGADAGLALTYTATGSIRACEPVVNDLTGRIALIERGPSEETDPCYFNRKVYHAEQAGAIGVVVFNHAEWVQEQGDVVRGGMSAGDTSIAVTIPALLFPRGMAQPWLDTLATGAPVCVRMSTLCCGGPITYGVCGTVASEPGADSSTSLAVVPNPFAAAATLTLSLARAQAVRVEAYDALGRRVALLHDGVLPAGAHRLTLDGAVLPPGVYVVRAAGEAFAVSRRVVRGR